MVEKVRLDHATVEAAVQKMFNNIVDTVPGYSLNVYGIPRGGIPIAYLFKSICDKTCKFAVSVVDDPTEADIFVDDIYDTGKTAKRYADEYGKPVFWAFDKAHEEGPDLFGMKVPKDKWIVFPWEVSDDHEEAGEDTVTRMLSRIGEDPNREGLLETPARVVKAWNTWFGGYGVEPSSVLKVFKDGSEGVDEMVLETDIPVYSHCEHHLAPIFGVAHVGYIPNGGVVGLSKLVRLVDVFARRLQVQERLTNQIADALQEELGALGVGVVLQCRHFCMESRGVKSSGVITTTSALRGALKDEHDARAEFLSLINMTRKGGPL